MSYSSSPINYLVSISKSSSSDCISLVNFASIFVKYSDIQRSFISASDALTWLKCFVFILLVLLNRTFFLERCLARENVSSFLHHLDFR